MTFLIPLRLSYSREPQCAYSKFIKKPQCRSRFQTQRLCPWPASSPVSCAPPTKTYYYIQRLVSKVFVMEMEYPSVRCLWKNSSTTECLTSGISSRDEVKPSVGMTSFSRNFSSSRSSAFRFSFLFLLGFSHLDLSAAAYPSHISCTIWFFRIKNV